MRICSSFFISTLQKYHIRQINVFPHTEYEIDIRNNEHVFIVRAKTN